MRADWTGINEIESIIHDMNIRSIEIDLFPEALTLVAKDMVEYIASFEKDDNGAIYYMIRCVHIDEAFAISQKSVLIGQGWVPGRQIWEDYITLAHQLVKRVKYIDVFDNTFVSNLMSPVYQFKEMCLKYRLKDL